MIVHLFIVPFTATALKPAGKNVMDIAALKAPNQITLQFDYGEDKFLSLLFRRAWARQSSSCLY